MNLKTELLTEARDQEKELKKKALIPGSANRYKSIAFFHKKVEHQIIYDRQLGKFSKIVYLTLVGRITRANEIMLDVESGGICELVKEK